MTTDLIQTVVDRELPKNVENSYLANIEKVCSFVVSGKMTPAINQLDAFIHKVQQDIGHEDIDAPTGNNLIRMATELIAIIQS